MRKTVLALLAFLALAPLAEAQQSIPTMPPNTVFGRLSGGGLPGPGAAIPLSSIFTPPITPRANNPANLYVATTGNDSNNCTAVGTPCLTLQGAVNKAGLNYDFQGSAITINIAAGTYTSGVVVAGSNVGALSATGGGSNQLGGSLLFVGAGSGSTTIGVTNCSSGVNGTGFYVTWGASVSLSGLTISTTCTNASDVLAAFNGHVYVGSDLIFGAAPAAKMRAYVNSTISGGLSGFTFTGNSTYGMLASSSSTIILGGSGVTFTLTGTPNFSTGFIDAIDGSLVDTGGSTITGSATGPRYSLGTSSTIDTEASTANLPGSILGALSNNSNYYINSGPCVGGAGGCPVVTAPTGLGSGATVTFQSGAGDHSGTIIMTAGSGASAAGTVDISTYSNVLGQNNGTGNCVTGLSSGSSFWSGTASIQSYYTSSGTAPDLSIRWANGGSALTNGQGYAITYVCP